MAIPKKFEDCLKSLTLKKLRNTELHISIPAPDRNSPAYLWFPKNLASDVGSLICEISEELERKNHVASKESPQKEFSLVILGVFALIPDKRNAVKILNEILDSISPWRINCQTFLNMESTNKTEFEIPPFKFGPVSLEKLKYSLKKAPLVGDEDAFWNMYKSGIKDKFAISRSLGDFRFIDFEKYKQEIIKQLTLQKNGDILFQFRNILIWYSNFLTNYFLKFFWDDFERIHHGMVDFDFPIIDTKKLIAEALTLCIAERLGSKRRRFSLLGKKIPSPTPSWEKIVEQYTSIQKDLKRNFNLDSFQDSKIPGSIKNFCRFTYSGHKELQDLKPNESFMNFFIAIELILAKKSDPSLTKTISGRLAAILCKREKDEFYAQQKRVSRLYDMRSKFVHSGEDLSYKACRELKTMCREILEWWIQV